jgi:hypothetical protein
MKSPMAQLFDRARSRRTVKAPASLWSDGGKEGSNARWSTPESPQLLPRLICLPSRAG